MIPENLVKATLREISWDANQDVVDGAHSLQVQFNPESLKVTFSNQNASGDQRGGSAIQYVGAGTTKLSFDLWFDVTSSHHGGGEATEDVRELTNQVLFFMTPQQQPPGPEGEERYLPPGVRFQWGRFLFEGVMDSLDETLEYFSEDGRPLRSKLSVALSKQEIRFEEGQQQGGSALGTAAAPSSGNQQAAAGDTVQGLAGDNWPSVAAANGIENPLDLAAGAVVDLNAGISLEGGLSAGASFDASLSAGASLGGGLRAGVAGGAGAGGGIGGGIGASAGGGIGGGLSGGVGLSGGIGGSAEIGGSLGGGGQLGLDAGAGGGVSVGGGATVGGAAASASASASASFDNKLRR